MTFEEWIEHYKPIKNHIDTNASYDGCAFETYGDEELYVRSCRESIVWTLVEGDDGSEVLISGFHYVNRMNYFITEVDHDHANPIEIMVLDEEDRDRGED